MMTNTNKTLYIPLYGKAKVSSMGIILRDKKAEEIWKKEGFALKGKAKSRWLAYYMSMRARVFDDAVTLRLGEMPSATVLHIGCGMDSRSHRLHTPNLWYDMDFEAVIKERRKYFRESETRRMLAADATQPQKWLHNFEKGGDALVVMEGVTMYLERRQMEKLVLALQEYFGNVILIADFYTEFAAKASKYKNPIKAVGAEIVSGMDSPYELLLNRGTDFVKEWDMTPPALINLLPQKDRAIFRKVFAGSFSKKLYRMYQYKITKE